MPLTYIPIEWGGGVNLLTDEQFLQPNEIRKAKNLFPVNPGRLSRRGSLGPAGRPSLAGGAGGIRYGRPIAAMIPPWVGSDLLAVIATRNLVGTAQTGYLTGEYPLAVYALGQTASVGIELGGYPNSVPAMVAFNKKIYVFGGYPCTVPGAVVADGVGGAATCTAFAFAGSGNSTVTPRVACSYRNRMVYANFGPGFESHLVMSDLYDPTLVGNDVLAVNGRNFIVGDTTGDEVVAMIEVMTVGAGSPAQSALLVLKRYSAFLVTGEPSQTTDTSDYLGTMEVVKFGVAAGCASPRTLVETPEGLFWAGPDEVWCYRPGALPFPVGRKIQAVLRESPEDRKYRWHAAYFNGVYRLAVFSPGQGPDDDSPCGEQWWLDLRDGAPESWQAARWWGPQIFHYVSDSTITTSAGVIGTYNMISEVRPGFPAALYGIEAGILVDLADNGFLRVQYDQPNGYDFVWTLTEPDYGPRSICGTSTDTNTTVATEFLSRQYDYADPLVDKLVQGVELSAWSSMPSVLSCDVISNGGVGGVNTLLGAVPSEGFIAGLSVTASSAGEASDSILAKVVEAVSLDVDPDEERPVGRTLQYRITSNGHYGYTTDASMPGEDYIYFTKKVGGVETAYTLSPGILGNQDPVAMIVSLCAAMASAAGVTVTAGLTNAGIASITSGTGGVTLRMDWNLSPLTKGMLVLLGFNVGSAPAFFTTLTGVANLESLLSPSLEISSIAAKLRPFRRRPTK